MKRGALVLLLLGCAAAIIALFAHGGRHGSRAAAGSRADAGGSSTGRRPALSAPVEVAAGTTVTAQEIQLERVGAGTLRVHVTTAGGGAPFQGELRINLIDESPRDPARVANGYERFIVDETGHARPD